MSYQALSSGFYLLPGLLTSFLASGLCPFYMFCTTIPYVLCRKQTSSPKTVFQSLLLGLRIESNLLGTVGPSFVSWLLLSILPVFRHTRQFEVFVLLRLPCFLDLVFMCASLLLTSLGGVLLCALVHFLVWRKQCSECLWDQWMPFYMLLSSLI